MNRTFFLFFLLLPVFSFAQKIDFSTNQGTVEFVYADGTKGTFSDVSATVKFDLSKLSGGSISGSVDVATIDTQNKMRNKHLQAKEFFDAENYPKMTFRSTSISEEKGVFTIKGLLKIKATEKEVIFKATEQYGQLVFTTTIYGLDFDVATHNKREKTNIDVTVKLTM